ncbi:hypothetical protein ACNKHU_18030 [Shigella flexneri]
MSSERAELPAGVTAVINGNEQRWLELESAACRSEENLLPPFYDTLTQIVIGSGAACLPWTSTWCVFKKHIQRHFYDFLW